jgi:aspartate ammonia-lyase
VLAVSLTKINNDLRWMGSGPNAGLGELSIPDLQPGSSIMPGKVNPVIPEAVMMVCARVIGNDATVAWAGATGNFELNVAIPVMGNALLESIRLLSNFMMRIELLQEKPCESICVLLYLIGIRSVAQAVIRLAQAQRCSLGMPMAMLFRRLMTKWMLLSNFLQN